ncbi:2-C-methyl-D-erythritol 2,4-cyclodiphosphate synthase [Peptostreptococcus stomatis]|uniref:2-C-methyl-D-erythritol 2,4-cyclodiphosphate synthase n=1 Tax=Peptostreptococcus stomatis TaxID=341694 RepID=UPI002804BBC7|nr:2-C-methyl-D-erythritol 2,4-cyclodiphosphate synthase [Peptostreptococcus stomatis]
MRVGIGYDVHKLVEDRDLIIGGVKIDYDRGLLGHSDADVLTHALIDAIFGALGEGDLGRHFPDTDPRFKGADSLKLLAYAKELMDKRGYRLGNADCTIIAQAPKMAPHLSSMIDNFARVLDTDKTNINVKATTEEGLGFTGSKEGISSQAIVLLVENRKKGL